MIRGRCPICKREFSGESLAALPGFPFCSERCRLVDLGRWIDGYAIPGRAAPTNAPPTNPALGVPDMDDEDDG